MVRKRRRSVTAAMAPMATKGSGQGVSGAKRGLPSAEYGYGVWIFSGITTWSETLIASYPQASACWARGP